MNWVILPFLLPLVTGLACLAIGSRTLFRRGVALASGAVQLAVALYWVWRCADGSINTLHIGAWTAPLGIVIVIDLLAALMLLLSAITALAAMSYGMFETPANKEHPLRLPLLQFLVAGINLSFTTGDLFNLFVAFEIMLIASYGLMTLEASGRSIKHAFPYLAINFIGSALFLCGAGLAYRLFGTLNFGQIAMRAQEMSDDPLVYLLALVFLVVTATKAGVFPLYYWLPKSYPILPTAVAALYSGMLTKVGVYVMLRLFCTVFPHSLGSLHTTIAWLAGATMIFGVLGAISRNTIRGILSFHILSQIGFMVLAIGFFTELAITAAILYIVHHIVVKAALFLVGGTARQLNGTDRLDQMGGLWKYTPLLGIVFLLQAMSLAGIPPLSGFWGKYFIIVTGLQQGEYWLVAASVVASILTLFSMLKIWLGAFWSPERESGVRLNHPGWKSMTAIPAAMAVVSLMIGLGVLFFFGLAQTAARSALDQSAYAAAVFSYEGKGERRLP